MRGKDSAYFLNRLCVVRYCSKRACAFTNARWAGGEFVEALNGDRAKGVNTL